ncbi:hypothetical protein RyT2_11530 [Pseudolactococcus yaeyamensis]
MSKWYVVQVATGRETQVVRELEKSGFRACAPQELLLIRKGGEWHKQTRLLFAGYAFVNCAWSAGNYHRVRALESVIRFLGNEHDEPCELAKDEAEMIERLSLESEIMPSLVKFYDDGSFEVLRGILKQFNLSSIRFNRRAKKAIVRLTIGGTEQDYKFAIQETSDS